MFVASDPLVVLLNAPEDERGHGFLTKAEYEDRIFGPSFPNVRDYFTENSYGQFIWKKAGIIGPIQYPDEGSDLGIRRRRIKELAFQAGFDFSVYDKNNDGIVSEDELSILIIENYNIVSAQADHPDFTVCSYPEGSSVNICSHVTNIDERDLAGAPHELSHLLGTWDLYGSNCLSQNASLMAGCGNLGFNPHVHVDPWHRIRLGWNKPRIYRLTDRGTCTTLDAAQIADTNLASSRPIILYDSTNGIKKNLFLEYRTQNTLAGGGYDEGVADEGLVIWHVQTENDTYKFEIIPSVINSGGWDAANFVVGAPNGLRGISELGNPYILKFWQASHGLFPLKLALDNWLTADGDNIFVRIGSMTSSSDSIDVEWGYNQAFQPYIYSLLTDNALIPGRIITLNGKFGVDTGNRIVKLSNGTETYDLETVAWSCSNVSAIIPDNVSPGNYRLYVYDNDTQTSPLNWIDLTLAEGEPSDYAIIGPAGGQLTSDDFEQTVTVQFPLGAVDTPTSVSYQTEPPQPTGDLKGINRFFSLIATQDDTPVHELYLLDFSG